MCNDYAESYIDLVSSYYILFTMLLVYVREDNNGAAQIVLLDHGLYEYIDTEERVALANLYKAIILKDEQSMQYHSELMNVKGDYI